MKSLVIIPARYASTRYPGKPLVELSGANGTAKTLVQRSWEAAMSSSKADRVVVATDDDRIADTAKAFGAQVVITAPTCRNGTERCAEACAQIGDGYDIIVNLQGDAPLTPSWFVDDLVDGLAANPEFDVATPVLPCSGAMRESLVQDRRAGRVGGTTAVFDAKRRGLYFSKEVIPFAAGPFAPDDPTPVFHHVGVYAYTPAALHRYMAAPEGPLERLEGLEQLRFLENGIAVLCVEVDGKGREFWELNNPEDKEKIEKILGSLGIE